MKILVLASRFPYPIEKGDKLRLYHQIRELSHAHEIILFALSDIRVSPDDFAEMERYCSRIYLFPLKKTGTAWRVLRAWLRGLPLQVGYFRQPALKSRLQEIIARENPDHVYCQLIRMAGYLEGLDAPPATLDYMDAFSLGTLRRAEKASRLLSPFLRMEARRVASWEKKVFSWFRHHTIISGQDRQVLEVESRDRIHIVPNGVDTNYFHPRPEGTQGYDLVFVGNMGYHPNIVAARFLVRAVMPLVWEVAPGVRLLIAGARPSAEVRSLAGERVSVPGWMADIRDAYAAGKVFVAPLFSGSGQQNKILEALAMGLPCITTPLVNNAIGAHPEREVLLADSAAGFASQILRLMHDTELAHALGAGGREMVCKNFSWQRSAGQLAALWQASATPSS